MTGTSVSIRKRSIAIPGHRKTSLTLEDDFWMALKFIATEQRIPVSSLVARVRNTMSGSNLSSALRLFVLSYYRQHTAHHTAAPKQ